MSAGLVPPEAAREGCVPGLSPWLVDGRLLPVSFMWGSCVCVCAQISLFYKDTNHLGLGPTLMNSTNSSATTLFASKVTF